MDELGWLQFSRVCELLFTAADRPLNIVPLWIPVGRPIADRLAELDARLLALFQGDEVADETLVLSNLPGEQAAGVVHDMTGGSGLRLNVIGAEEICTSLDRHPAIRRELPSILGLRDIEALIDPDVAARATFDVDRAHALARVFWPTRAYAHTLAVLDQHRFVVLTGPPEMGKTAISEMVALAQMTDGWEAHECTDPEQIWRVFDKTRRQVFIADDAFGSTEYRPDRAEHWALALGRLLRMLDANHWLIWTSRPAPLKAGLRRVQRERGSERFPSPGQVLVDASDLNLEEKTLILFRHAKAHGVDEARGNLLRMAGVSLVEHPYFTPERIRRFVTHRLDELAALRPNHARLRQVVERELATPTEAMSNSFQALSQEHRDLLIAMLDAPAGLIDERTLATTVRRHHPGGLSNSPAEMIDRLTDHFLRITPMGIGWVHPSWRDLVIDRLRSDGPARRRFLAACGVDGAMLALSRQGGGQGERALPLLADDTDWDLLADRVYELMRDLEPGELARVLLGLEATISDDLDPRGAREPQSVEVQSLAMQALDATRRAWGGADRTFPAFLLEAWYRLRRRVYQEVEAPQILSTWVELQPGPMLLQRPDLAELLRADEWLSVAQVLNTYAPEILEGIGFFERDRDLLVELVLKLTGADGPHELVRDLAESVLTRIGTLIPDLADTARNVIVTNAELDQDRWWVPHDLAAPPSQERVAADFEFTRDDIDRVLGDL